MTRSNRGATASCWSCGHPRSSVSLRIVGTPRRLCDACSGIAEQDVETRGRLRELFGCMTWEGIVPNKHHRKVKRLCRHPFSEIAALAEEMLTETAFQREMSAARREHEHALLESITKRHEAWVESRVERLGTEIAEHF